jgi:oxalate decarboxylase
MEKISRRNIIGAAAGVFAGGVLANEAAAAGAMPLDDKPGSKPTDPATSAGKTESIYKYRLGESTPRHYGESTAREHKAHDFPMSASMTGGIIKLAVGDFREPHWHPNADEWLFVMAGTIRMTIVDAKGVASHFTCGPEDVAFTPQGLGHYVENIGDTEASVMLVHNNGELTTVNLSDWVAGGSKSVFAATLDLPANALDDTPTKRVYIGRKKTK